MIRENGGAKEVAPFTGAWIEMVICLDNGLAVRKSLPSRERGLKWRVLGDFLGVCLVAPFTGAWIEITEDYQILLTINCRSLHGSVD